jgi:hypothetical protein
MNHHKQQVLLSLSPKHALNASTFLNLYCLYTRLNLYHSYLDY